MKRPDVFDYLEHQSFLKAWFVFLKEEKKLTLRNVSASSGISASSLSLCMKGDRNWTLVLLGKLIPHLGLKKPEQEALRLLFMIGTTENPMERLSAFDELRRIPQYSQKQRDSSTVFMYLRHWVNVAIRELIQLPDFQDDIKWIRERLCFTPSEQEVERSLKFLIKESYIKKDEHGHWYSPQQHLECQDGVFKLSLGEYHRQVLQLVQRSIEEIPRDLRLILGHTVALSGDQKIKAEQILKGALNEIQELNKEKKTPDQLFQFELVMIPLTQKGEVA